MATPGTVVPASSLMTPGGDQGSPAYTVTTANFTVPGVGSTVTVTMNDVSWMTAGEVVWVANANGGGVAGALKVQSISGQQVTLLNILGSTQLGDMQKSVYDTNNDGIVDQANHVPLSTSSRSGELCQVSGNTSDFVDGSNNCQPLRPVIYDVRLRSFNALGNPGAEVDQRNGGAAVNMAAGTVSAWACDRWQATKAAATMNVSVGQQISQLVPLPGTNFGISARTFFVQLNTQQASLAAGEYLQTIQFVEGPQLRELIGDVHSISILAWCNAALSFTIRLTSPGTPLYTLTKLCTLPANTWTLLTLPNLPLWTPSATWPLSPGANGYVLGIGLGAGSTYTSPANDTWQSGNFACGPGTTNFGSLPTGTVFQVAFIQHEPGPRCTQLIDKPFNQNLDECLRYYQKTYPYNVRFGSVSSAGAIAYVTLSGVQPIYAVRFHKPMAKTPTVTIYSSQTGTANALYDANAAIDRAVSGVNVPGETGYGGVTLTTPNAASTNYYWQHVADTGW